MLVRGDDAPFVTVVGLLQAYADQSNRLAIDAQLVKAGHTGRPGSTFEVVPGLSLRFALAAIYDALSANLTDEGRYALDVRLGLVESEHEQHLADDVPTSTNDPVAMAALRQFGEPEYV